MQVAPNQIELHDFSQYRFFFFFFFFVFFFFADKVCRPLVSLLLWAINRNVTRLSKRWDLTYGIKESLDQQLLQTELNLLRAPPQQGGLFSIREGQGDDLKCPRLYTSESVWALEETHLLGVWIYCSLDCYSLPTNNWGEHMVSRIIKSWPRFWAYIWERDACYPGRNCSVTRTLTGTIQNSHT